MFSQIWHSAGPDRISDKNIDADGRRIGMPRPPFFANIADQGEFTVLPVDQIAICFHQRPACLRLSTPSMSAK
jgi:hypothetical protein